MSKEDVGLSILFKLLNLFLPEDNNELPIPLDLTGLIDDIGGKYKSHSFTSIKNEGKNFYVLKSESLGISLNELEGTYEDLTLVYYLGKWLLAQNYYTNLNS